MLYLTSNNLTSVISKNRNDGMEPDYMAVNPGDWLTSSIKACCEKFFAGYMYEDCMGFYPPDHDDCNKALFYPDWSGSNEGCLGDGTSAFSMLVYFTYYIMHTTSACSLTHLFIQSILSFR